MGSDIILKVNNLRKAYPGNSLNYMLLDNISFELKDHTFSSILAPQNSNKTLMMKILAGLDVPSSGSVELPNNKLVYIPSQPSSFPWLNVKKNVELGMRYRKTGNTVEIQPLINIVGLHGYEEHFPNNKSLGFRFRIALARALAADPKLLVIDEPFNEMNHITKLEIYVLLRRIFLKTGISFLVATSNISEAVFLSDRIMILGSESTGIIYDLIISLAETHSKELFEDPAYKSKIKEIEELVKSEGSMKFNSFLI